MGGRLFARASHLWFARAMDGFDPATSFGAHYDETLRGDEQDAACFLADLAGSGPALEFAVGTGRIALPLASTGIRVDGVELSPDMAGRLRARQGGAAIAVTPGDISTADAPGGPYTLVYLVFQYDREPADPRRSGAVLRERRPAPHRRRGVRR